MDAKGYPTHTTAALKGYPTDTADGRCGPRGAGMVPGLGEARWVGAGRCGPAGQAEAVPGKGYPMDTNGYPTDTDGGAAGGR